MSKDAILGRIRDSLSGNTIASSAVSYASPMKITEKDLRSEYIKNQIANKSIVYEADRNSVYDKVDEILKSLEAKKILCNLDISIDNKKLKGDYNIIDYDKTVDETRGELFGIDTSIVEARCGVANLGIVCLTSNEQAPRLSSLVTNNCIFLLKKESIVENLFEATEFAKSFEEKRSSSKVLPSNIIFVAGPSRTADIELQAVFGVHGPRNTYVILY